jgi:hypothetical protein
MGLFGDPFGHARATGADLPHSPPWRESNRPHVPERRGIEKLGKSLEALPRLGLLIVEEIVLFGHSGSLRTHGWGLPDEPVAAVAEPERARRTSSLLEQGRAPSDAKGVTDSAARGARQRVSGGADRAWRQSAPRRPAAGCVPRRDGSSVRASSRLVGETVTSNEMRELHQRQCEHRFRERVYEEAKILRQLHHRHPSFLLRY